MATADIRVDNDATKCLGGALTNSLTTAAFDDLQDLAAAATITATGTQVIPAADWTEANCLAHSHFCVNTATGAANDPFAETDLLNNWRCVDITAKRFCTIGGIRYCLVNEKCSNIRRVS